MYERGTLDAEQDELNLFYYQHYYYYRKGYDKARKRVYRTSRALPFSRSLLLFAAASIVVILLSAVGLQFYQGSSAPTDRTASVDAVSTRTPRPTRTPAPVITATATLTSTDILQPALRPGSQARVVNVGAAALLARSGPGTNEPVQARFVEGTEVTILEGPVEADGYTWWLIEADSRNGWSADSSPEGLVWLEPL